MKFTILIKEVHDIERATTNVARPLLEPFVIEFFKEIQELENNGVDTEIEKDRYKKWSSEYIKYKNGIN